MRTLRTLLLLKTLSSLLLLFLFSTFLPFQYYHHVAAAQQKITNTTPKQQTPTLKPSSLPSSSPVTGASYFVLCTADGAIYSLNAWTGDNTRTILQTPPLLSTHTSSTPHKLSDKHNNNNNNNNNNDNNKHAVSIIPALDGRLYWKHQRQHNNDYITEPLPMTIQSLLENPVRSCSDDNNDVAPHECGILTATAQTSLVALDAVAGSLKWHTVPKGSNSHDRLKSKSRKSATLLLQRRDFYIQHVSVDNGLPLWNATLGTYQALDFDVSPPSDIDDEQEHNDDDDNDRSFSDLEEDPEYLDYDDIEDISLDFESNNENDFDDDSDDEDIDDPVYVETSNDDDDYAVPAVVFTNQGRTLVAAHPKTKQILWRIDTPSTLASVFAMYKGQWQGVQVWSEEVLSSFTHNAAPPHYWATLPPSSYIEAETIHNNNNIDNNKDQEKQQQEVDRENNNDKSVCSPVSMLEAVNQQRNDLPSYVVQELEAGQKDRFHTRPYLELPAPPPIDVPDGILITWPIVTALTTGLIVVAIGGYTWYKRKKEFWMKLLQREVELNKSLGSKEKESNSNSPSLSAVKQPEEPPIPALTATEVVTSSNSTQVVLPYQGIPLVQYSRYASEFKEVVALGRGGFGTVFQCQNVLDGRDYAIKKVAIRSKSTDEAFRSHLQRVLREVKILAVLDHPNIVRYYTAWLELEDSASPHDESETNDTLSRRFSSTFLLSQATELGQSRSRAPRNALGRKSVELNNNSAISEEEDVLSYIPSRHYYDNDDDDDFIYFEDSSKENSLTIAEDSQQKSNHLFNESERSIIRSRSSIRRISSHNTYASKDLNTTRDVMAVIPSVDTNDTDLDKIINIDNEIVAELEKPPLKMTLKHTLYIQMQLCSQRTIADFLGDKVARQGRAGDGSIDAPKALRAFLQIALAVQHVHAQGLIHRDLKPSNCFMDETGNVKVGDFGLSRESSDRDDGLKLIESSEDLLDEDHTAGVGTRSYASPEQMNGSDYDASADVYSLGIILFELCYPMYTGMERSICLSKLRHLEFPDKWQDGIGQAFPKMQDLIQSMLSTSPSARPSATTVTKHIQSLMGEFTILTLDDQPDIVMLRIEAVDRDDVLQHTMQLLREFSVPLEIVQYGLRSSKTSNKSTSILEFALRSSVGSSDLLAHLKKYPEIIVAQVSHASSLTD